MIRKKAYHLLGATLVAAVAVASCEDGSTDVDEALTIALAEQAAVDAHQDAEHMRSPGVPGLRFPTMIPGLGDRPACPQQDGVYVCTHDRLGITTTHVVTFYDEAGAVQDSYDDLTTASIHILSETDGSRGHGPVSATVSRTRDVVVSGLVGEETSRVWNGTAEGEAVHTRLSSDEEARVNSVSSASTITDLEIPHPRTGQSWPLGGSIATTITVVGGPREGEHHATVTFDGTQFATVEMNGEVFTVDLTTLRGHRGPRHPQGG